MAQHRILYLADRLLPPGGIQTLSLTCLRILQELGVEKGLSHRCIVRHGEVPPGVQCATARGAGWRMQWMVVKEWFFGRRNLIFADHLYVGRFASRIGARHVFWAHLFECDPPLEPMHLRTMRNSFRIVCDSEFTQQYLSNLYPSFRKKLCVVHLGDRPRAPLSRPHYAENVPSQHLVMIGRMAADERYKGHDQVIEALPGIVERFPKCSVSMIGGGADLVRLKEKVERLGLSAHVRFLQGLNDEELIESVKNSCGLLLPSLKEAFGLVYLYAMWAGVPAIALRGTAGEEVLGECGIYAEVQTPAAIESAIVNALSGEWRFSRESQQRYENHFSYEAFKRRLSEFLERECSS